MKNESYNPFPDLPPPIDVDIRICFAIAWYDSEEKAERAGEASRKAGNYYNGGWYDGRLCGRDPSWDTRDDDGNVDAWAVTF